MHLRDGILTSIATPAASAAGGLLTAGWLLGGGPTTAVGLTGVGLLGVGAGGGLLLSRMYRRSSRRLAAELERGARLAAEVRELRAIEWPDDLMSPTVAGINGCLTAAGDAAEAARADSRRTGVELKLVAQQLRHLEGIVGGLEDALLVTDAFDEAVLANAAASKLFGRDPEQTAGTPAGELAGDARLADLIAEVRQGGSATRRTEEAELTPHGDDRPRVYRVTLAPLTADNGRAAGVVTVLRDTTRERELQQQKNDFVSSVTHELRTPLASIRAYVEMLVDGDAETEAERQEYCEIVQGEAERLSSMIDSILNISRIESGLVKIDRRPHSPMAIAEKALGVIEPQAKLKDITVKRELLPAIFQVVADGELLYQVVLNLLSNAVKYTPSGGTVRLVTEADEGRGVIVTKVIDDGAGIPEADLPHVFEKFYRVERNSKMAKGTGLGLPLVKRVIESDFGGRVWAESVVDRGSTFAFELPMVGREERREPPALRKAA